MHGDVAVAAEHYQVFILVVPIVANRALGVFLWHESPFVRTHVLELYILHNLGHFSLFVQLNRLQDLLVVQIVLSLLNWLNMLEKLFALPGGEVNVEQDLIWVLQVPVIVLDNVLSELRVDLRQEGLVVVEERIRIVGERVWRG